MATRAIAALVFTAILLHLGASAPQKRWYPGTLQIAPQQTRTCQEFDFPICNKIGYNTTSLPNKRNQTTIQTAADELDDFMAVMSSKCSSYVATLFCFTYFPFCDINQWEALDVQDKNEYEPIYPCQDACRRVSDDCRAEFERQSSFKWPLVFQNCGAFPETNCAMGPDPENLTDTDDEDENGEEDGENETELPATEVTTTPDCSSKVTECDYRTKCTANFFKRKDHNFAAKVTFTGDVYLADSLSTADIRAFTFSNVTQYHELLDTCTLESAPDLQDYSHIYSNTPEGCNNCFNIDFGREYLIAGHYDSGKNRFELRRQNALLAPWTDKNDRSVPRYIAAGNEVRQEATPPTTCP